jgi:hypothetical protein
MRRTASHAKHVAAANDLPAAAGKPVGGALIGFTWEQISPGHSNRWPDIQTSLNRAQTHFQSAVPLTGANDAMGGEASLLHRLEV